MAADELTVSLKVRRSVVLEKNKEIVQALYAGERLSVVINLY